MAPSPRNDLHRQEGEPATLFADRQEADRSLRASQRNEALPFQYSLSIARPRALQRARRRRGIECRSFVAAHAGHIWYGEVMRGSKVLVDGKLRRTYVVSFMVDASRLITHSAFCPAETALEVEGVLKQALLERGVPVRLVIDNGSAFRGAFRVDRQDPKTGRRSSQGEGRRYRVRKRRFPGQGNPPGPAGQHPPQK